MEEQPRLIPQPDGALLRVMSLAFVAVAAYWFAQYARF